MDAGSQVIYSGDKSNVIITADQTTVVPIVLLEVNAPPVYSESVPTIDSVTVPTFKVEPNGTLSISATGSDPDTGDTLDYTWSATCGSFDDASSASATWTAPSTEGPCTLTITIEDSTGNTDETDFNVTVEIPPEPGSFAWAKSAGGSGNDSGRGITSLTDGSTIAIVNFTGTATFGTYTITSVGDYDTAIIKYKRDGSIDWINTCTGTKNVAAYAIDSLPNDDSFIITGLLTGTGLFDSFSVTSNGNSDFFIAKYDSSGNAIWVNSAGGSDTDYGMAITILPDGSSITTGLFRDTATFAGVPMTSLGGYDTFIIKHDINGNPVWAKNAGSGISNTVAYGIDSLTDGSSIITGEFANTANFGGFDLTSEGSSDIFIVKYDTNGNAVWAKRAGGSANNDVGFGINTLPDGSSILTGYFAVSASFDTIPITSNGAYDAFVAKYDSNGNTLWVNGGGSTSSDQGLAISTLADGSLIITGIFYETATFDDETLTSTGNSDAFIVKYDSDGNVLWANSGGGTSIDQGRAISTLADGSLIVTGFFSETATFGDKTLTSAGGYEFFITKLNP
jgi:hypothetical protein